MTENPELEILRVRAETEYLRKISLKEAKDDLSNAIYAAARHIEEFEYLGKIRGNGHHQRQKIAEFAAKMLEDNWIEKQIQDKSSSKI